MWMMRKKQCTWTKLWSWFGGDWGGLKRKKWKKWQKRVEKLCISILHDHSKILHSHAKWTRRHFCCKSKGNLKVDFAWPCENFAQSCEMLQESEIGANAFFTSHNHAKLLELMWNCCSSCEIPGSHAKWAFYYKLHISWWKSLWKTS